MNFRASSELLYAESELEGILTMLSESDLLEEKGDILQYLVDTYGLEYDTGWCEHIFIDFYFVFNC